MTVDTNQIPVIITGEDQINFIKDYLGSVEPNKGNNMNEQTNDVAFEPMDKAGAVAHGENADGTVTYQIVEGDTFVDNKLVAKSPEVVGTIQIEENHD